MRKTLHISQEGLAFAQGLGQAIGFFCDPTEEGETARQEIRNTVYAKGTLTDLAKFGPAWVRECSSRIIRGAPRTQELDYGVNTGLFSRRDITKAKQAYQESQRE